jgi:hypothetical protein
MTLPLRNSMILTVYASRSWYARRLAWIMTPQGLQIASSEDSLARLGIITNDIIIVNNVFRVCIADCRRVPVRIQGRTDLFLLHGLL